MASPLKTFVLRLPSRPAGLAKASTTCCARATLTTTARPLVAPKTALLRPSSPAAFAPRIQQQLRTKTTADSQSAQKEIDAGTFRTASDLGKQRPSAQTPPHEHVASNPAGTPPPLDWNTFFKLRLRRRRIQVFFSATTGLVAFVAGGGLMATGIAEPLVAQVPLDPFITIGLLTLACGGVGWLVGPSLGSQVFYALNRRFKGQIKQKEAEFFARIKKNRVDPSNSSAANPVPDFYGEKIQSVKGYRQWLKDQRAFNRKKSANLI